MVLGPAACDAAFVVLGLVYPAYSCYKALEQRARADALRAWCQYWVLLALTVAVLRVTDAAVSWLPMYHELRVAWAVYLWHPRTMGASYVYAAALQPALAAREVAIDNALQDVSDNVGGAARQYGRRLAAYAQARFAQLVAALPAETAHQHGGAGAAAAGRAYTPRGGGAANQAAYHYAE